MDIRRHRAHRSLRQRDGVTEKIWYDEQQRVLRDEYYTPDGILQTAPSMIF